MGIFQPVTFKWKEQEYVVPANQVMGLIAQIEDVITLAELLKRKGAPLAKVAMAYASALRYAGAKVDDEEIYKDMFGGGASETIQVAIAGLLHMMIPPEEVAEKGKKERLQDAES